MSDCVRQLPRCPEAVSLSLVVQSEADVYAAAAHCKSAALGLGISEYRASMFGMAVSEIAMNTVRYAGGGCVLVKVMPRGVDATVEDQGPGIASLSQAFQDGYSTFAGQSLGLGLGAASRCVDELTVYRSDANGTAVGLRQYLPVSDEDVTVRAISHPAVNEIYNCNRYVLKDYQGDKTLIALIDGAGDCGGRAEAARIANFIAETVRSCFSYPLDEMVRQCHAALVQDSISSRSNKAKVCLLRVTPGEIEYVGIGLPCARWLYGNDEPFPVQPGDLGKFMPERIDVYTVPRPSRFCLALHSAGIVWREPVNFIGDNRRRDLYGLVQSLFDACAEATIDATIIVVRGGCHE
ncbi:ATP-binding protein [Photobacterium atrarenae]|uniref:Histidine kinase/HSP90-like ATPase domain-containing protein n=1 Tax=Photobacterium atrarenae TaxID=865757 RepID=A0ABY5GJ94_9GAMM|nr:ATP-binding protein [Photobacterium atrarenae]UTV29375.1 hypothetical protein NNL38_20330 [Photobacterium atrarenae]